VSLREPGRNLQIQSTAPLNVSGSHFRTRRAKPQRPLCPDETCMEVTALKDQAETCRHFADRTIAERGVRYGRVAMIPTSAKNKAPPERTLDERDAGGRMSVPSHSRHSDSRPTTSVSPSSTDIARPVP